MSRSWSLLRQGDEGMKNLQQGSRGQGGDGRDGDRHLQTPADRPPATAISQGAAGQRGMKPVLGAETPSAALNWVPRHHKPLDFGARVSLPLDFGGRVSLPPDFGARISLPLEFWGQNLPSPEFWGQSLPSPGFWGQNLPFP